MIQFDKLSRVISESGESGQWAHVSLDQVRDLFPKVKIGRYCETPRHAHQLIPAVVFHAVFWPKRVETWVSCWNCYQSMLGQ